MMVVMKGGEGVGWCLSEGVARKRGIEGADETRSWDPDSEEKSVMKRGVMMVVIKEVSKGPLRENPQSTSIVYSVQGQIVRVKG